MVLDTLGHSSLYKKSTTLLSWRSGLRIWGVFIESPYCLFNYVRVSFLFILLNSDHLHKILLTSRDLSLIHYFLLLNLVILSFCVILFCTHLCYPKGTGELKRFNTYINFVFNIVITPRFTCISLMNSLIFTSPHFLDSIHIKSVWPFFYCGHPSSHTKILR